jgi:hypothetical protein
MSSRYQLIKFIITIPNHPIPISCHVTDGAQLEYSLKRDMITETHERV